MFKREILIIFIGVSLLIATSLFFFKEEMSGNPDLNPTLGLNEKMIAINGQKLAVEIADEPQEQSQGLSDRTSLGQDKGMLFVFPQPLMPAFWMKNMHFSLDMLWINADGKVIAITKNISPDTYPNTFQPPSPVKYVLEVNAGWSDKNSIKIGDAMTIE